MTRTPFVFQLTRAECGLACLAMVARAHGRATALAELRDLIEVGRDGVSAHTLVETAPALGLKARAISLAADRVLSLPRPAICLWENDHFVVVHRVSRRAVHVLDPARGRRRLRHDEFAASFRNVALLFAPDPASVPSPQKRRPPRLWRPLTSEIRKASCVIGGLLLVSLVAHLLSLAGPLLVGRTVDAFGRTARVGVIGLAIAAFALVALTAAAAALRSRFTLALQRRLDRHLTGGFFGHLVSLPHVELERRGTGDLLSRMESLTLARLGLTSQVVNTVLDAGLLVVATAAIVARSTALGLVTSVGVAVQLVPLVMCARRLHEDTVRATMGEGAVHGFTAEALQGIATIKSLGAEGAAERRFRALAATRLDAEARRDRLAGRVEAILVSARTATPIAVLLAGLPGVEAHQMTIGRLIALVGLATAAVGPASSVVSGARSLQAVRSHLIRLTDLWAIDAEEAGGEVTLEGTVELRDVGVRYAGCRDWALRGVTMTIRPGEHIGVVGRSGSGKSTLVKVLAGLIAPTEGVVLVDGRSTTSLCPRALRQAVGVVLQDVWLFAGTIEENIVVDREGITTEALRRAAALAEIDTDIDELPLGYRTRLSDGGGGLSGGQRQRVAIARALATEPRVLIFDEATSNLDGTTEASVAAALDSVGATRFSVTHRLSTIRHCDHVVVFEGGRVVQEGRPDALGAIDGPFRRFVVDSTHTTSPQVEGP